MQHPNMEAKPSGRVLHPSSPLKDDNVEEKTTTGKVQLTLSGIIDKYNRLVDVATNNKALVKKKSSNLHTAKATSQNTFSPPESTIGSDNERQNRKRCKACEARRLEKEALSAKHSSSHKSRCSKVSTPMSEARKSETGMKTSSTTDNAWVEYKKEFEGRARKWRIDSFPKPINFYGVLFKKVLPNQTKPTTSNK